MISAAAIAFCLAALAAISWRFYTRAPALPHAPMQWGFDGKPTWRAPRLIAALFTPAVAVLVLAATLAPAATRGDVDNPIIQGVLLLEAAIFIATHAAHTHFALRDVLGITKR